MKPSRILVALSQAVTATVFLGVAAAALATEPSASQSPPSKETRGKMATLHEKMAACLRSDKALADCREEMQQNCLAMMGDQGCPTMMRGMHGWMKPKQKE